MLPQNVAYPLAAVIGLVVAVSLVALPNLAPEGAKCTTERECSEGQYCLYGNEFAPQQNGTCVSSLPEQCSTLGCSISGPKGGSQPPGANVYRDEGLGFSLTYPDNWFLSGSRYTNAIRLVNYYERDPSSFPEKDRAVITAGLPETVASEADLMERFDNIAKAWPNSAVERFTLGGNPAIRVSYTRAAERVGGQCAEGFCPPEPDYDIAGIELAVAKGLRIIYVTGRAPSSADPEVFEEIAEIQDSIEFLPQPAGTGIS